MSFFIFLTFSEISIIFLTMFLGLSSLGMMLMLMVIWGPSLGMMLMLMVIWGLTILGVELCIGSCQEHVEDDVFLV